MAVSMKVVNTPKATYSAAGESPPAAVIQLDSRDDSALIWLPTGTGPTAGALAMIELGGNYSSGVDEGAVPKILASFIGSPAHAAGCYVASVTSRTIVIACATAPAGSLPATASGIGVVIHGDL